MKKMAIVLGLVAALVAGCKAFYVRHKSPESVRVSISDNFSGQGTDPVYVLPKSERTYKDTAFANPGEDLVLNAVVEDATGELVAHGKIAPITVTATHKNIAERGGKIKLSFDVRVPSSILSNDRQVRVVPHLLLDDGSKMLDRIFITGKSYRDQQNKGYERYNKYFASIIPDSVDFLKAFGYLGLLQYFTERNIEDRPRGEFGVTEPEAIDYYIKHYLVKANRRRKDRLEEVFRKCVKDPVDRLGVRLDTVLEDPSGGLVYRYVQDLQPSGGMHRLRLVFDGSVHNYGKRLFGFSSPDTLTYYVSSLVQLADTSARYREHTLARDVSVSTLAYIEFEKGSWEIDTALGNNREEIARIKTDLDSLSSSKLFAADSILVEASCSPEGSYAFNTVLSGKRAESVASYFSAIYDQKRGGTQFRYSYVPENWDLLKELIMKDSLVKDRSGALAVFSETDYDRREDLLSRCSDYPHIRSVLYPKLRRIVFRFCMHRRIYDTVRSRVEVDEGYSRGLEALQNRDYKQAVQLLRPYSDLNTAIAYLCLDYNASALDILSRQAQTPVVKYLMALSYRRMGDEDKAMEFYRSAIEEDPHLKFRSALDPEMEELLERLD
ncbi:MAG: tetratricopeptide repeat protein [Bacteroidales bacterium]|nr:tetratricopeptide repeat protein [Bacteroidales bacterium]